MNFFFLRGLCCLGVFINHFNGYLNGFIFVWIFFSLSGYLLTKKLIKKKLSYLQFLKNRALRLLPTYYFVQIATIIIIIFFLNQNLYDKPFLKELIALLIPLHIPNFYNTMFIFNSVLWSLQLEIYFVLIIFFLYKNFLKISFFVFFLILLNLFVFNNLNIFPNHYPSFFYNIIFFMSGVVAYYFRNIFNFKYYIQYSLMILILILSILKINEQFLLAKLPLIFFLLIIPTISYFDDNKKKNIYSKNYILNIFVFLGIISYPLYLIHKIILKLLFENFSFMSINLFGFCICLSFTIIISYLIHLYIEKKFRY